MWTVTVKRHFVDTDEVTKNGKVKKRPVTHRALYVNCPERAVADSGHYRIVLRSGRYTVSALPRVRESQWEHPSGKPAVWHTLGNEYARTADSPMNHLEMEAWLASTMGSKDKAQEALFTLLTQEPEKKGE